MARVFEYGIEKRKKMQRKADPFRDRRSGEDRRVRYSLEYFRKGNLERRSEVERRQSGERRKGCTRVSQWSSVCPDYNEKAIQEGRIDL